MQTCTRRVLCDLRVVVWSSRGGGASVLCHLLWSCDADLKQVDLMNLSEQLPNTLPSNSSKRPLLLPMCTLIVGTLIHGVLDKGMNEWQAPRFGEQNGDTPALS